MPLTLDSDMITLMIEDNGRGFTPSDLEEAILKQGTGLIGMIERLERVDGRLTIEDMAAA